MEILKINDPVSGGMFLSYKCSGKCKHCMYACSGNWNEDWIDLEGAEDVLEYLSGRVNRNYGLSTSIGFNSGIHLTGGEPFLNYELLLELTDMAHDLEVPGLFVETNCFWCRGDDIVRERFESLKDSGLQGLMISVNPFTLEHVPLENSLRAIEVGREIFGRNLMVYQESFLRKMRRKDVEGTVSLERTREILGNDFLANLELLPRGRFVYSLDDFFEKYSARHFFGKSCEEELKRGWHFHVDNYFNYIPAYCGGISLGDARNLDEILEGINLRDHPILRFLSDDLGDLYDYAVQEFGYSEREGGYISKCHLCLDIRRHLVEETDEFDELSPREFYKRI